MAAAASLVDRISSRGLAFKRLRPQNAPSEEADVAPIQTSVVCPLDGREKCDWRSWWTKAADRYAQHVAEAGTDVLAGGAVGSHSPKKRPRIEALPAVGLPEKQMRTPRQHDDEETVIVGEDAADAEQLQSASSDCACSICCNALSASEAFRLPCGHGWYCKRCIARYAEMRIGAGAARIDCPECLQPVAEHVLNRLLPPNLLVRLQAQSLEQAVASSHDMWSCPTPDCPMRVAVEAGAPKRFECPLCQKTACVRCGAQPFHKGLSCRSHQERSKRRSLEGLMEWMRETGSKQCPNCHSAVTKQNLQQQSSQRVECHKMMCRVCRTRFCFKCLKILTDTSTCQCTNELHGFVDPLNGRRVEHLKKGCGTAKQAK
mmetsp:Transcript_41132/g.74283  ORF Transcript_41132/g.74283 Transcript_41132/m.74283 type:complete len:374 (-) Transcript_41132:105-1226(-)